MNLAAGKKDLLNRSKLLIPDSKINFESTLLYTYVMLCLRGCPGMAIIPFSASGSMQTGKGGGAHGFNGSGW